MKVRIELNENFAQQLLRDNDFMNRLSLTYNAQNLLEEIWIINNVLDNEEITFRGQVLNLIKADFCRIFNVDQANVQVANENDTVLPSILLNLSANFKLRKVASIIEFQLN